MSLLTPEELANKRSRAFSLPLGCPDSQWPSAEAALAEINRWASDHKKPGGGWGVTWAKGVYPGNSKRGPQRPLCCDQHRKKTCGWQGWLEETTAGWMWYSFKAHDCKTTPAADGHVPGHSHTCNVTMGQRLVHATQRNIPRELHDDAQLMRKSGCSIKDVENWLRLKMTQSGDDAAFTYADVRQLVGASTSERAWDATFFIETLAERESSRGLPFFIKLDEDGRLENAFFLMDGGLEVAAVGYVSRG